MRKFTLLSLCLTLFFLGASSAAERLIIFGDSLSDTGNSNVATNGQVPPPELYGTTKFPGRWTNGQNWVDYLPGVAQSFGVKVEPVTAYLQDPGSDQATNFAFGGATSGAGNVINNALPGNLTLPGFLAEIPIYLNSVGDLASAGDRYVIWIGANDFSAGISPVQTVANIKKGIAELSAKGARNFVVINVPDLSLTPEVRALGGATILAAKRFVLTTNVLLEVELLRFAFQERIRINLVDINRIFLPLVDSPGRFGFTNSSGFALAALAVNPSVNPDDYVFWDDFHPTTRAHFFAAEFLFKALFLQRDFHQFLSRR
jgi:phospholipase/lecithinase/hemolysin